MEEKEVPAQWEKGFDVVTHREIGIIPGRDYEEPIEQHPLENVLCSSKREAEAAIAPNAHMFFPARLSSAGPERPPELVHEWMRGKRELLSAFAEPDRNGEGDG